MKTCNTLKQSTKVKQNFKFGKLIIAFNQKQKHQHWAWGVIVDILLKYVSRYQWMPTIYIHIFAMVCISIH
jgi:hypothetical protein